MVYFWHYLAGVIVIIFITDYISMYFHFFYKNHSFHYKILVSANTNVIYVNFTIFSYTKSNKKVISKILFLWHNTFGGLTLKTKSSERGLEEDRLYKEGKTWRGKEFQCPALDIKKQTSNWTILTQYLWDSRLSAWPSHRRRHVSTK